jgi:hypothetical protein
MSDLHAIPTYRTLRLYEWLALLTMLLLAAGVRAESVYKCVGGDVIAYQSKPCADMSRATVIDIAPAPAFAPSPTYAISKPHKETASFTKRNMHAERKPIKNAFECRGSDGTVFYRLGHCPRSVAGDAQDRHGGAKANAAKSVSISGHPVSRDEACAEMRRAGAIGRKGHEFDESISTYDRNIGNGPCK